MRAPRRLLTAAILLGLAAPVAAQDWWEAGLPEDSVTPVRHMEIQEEERGKTLQVVDWEKATIVVRAMGTADPSTAVNLAQMQILAEEAARVMAQFRLAEAVKGLHLTAETTVQNAMVTDQTVRTRVEAYLQGVRYGEPRRITMPDGSVQVEIAAAISFNGDQGLRRVLPVPPPAPRPAAEPQRAARRPPPPPSPPPQPFTGLIIDAGGLGLENGLYPRVLTEDGNELYGTGTLDPEVAVDPGAVGYAGSVERARLQSERVGANPLQVKAVRVEGRVNVVVSEEDVQLIRSANASRKFLDEAAVVLVNS